MHVVASFPAQARDGGYSLRHCRDRFPVGVIGQETLGQDGPGR
jgi:hypothetical protein